MVVTFVLGRAPRANAPLRPRQVGRRASGIGGRASPSDFERPMGSMREAASSSSAACLGFCLIVASERRNERLCTRIRRTHAFRLLQQGLEFLITHRRCPLSEEEELPTSRAIRAISNAFRNGAQRVAVALKASAAVSGLPGVVEVFHVGQCDARGVACGVAACAALCSPIRRPRRTRALHGCVEHDLSRPQPMEGRWGWALTRPVAVHGLCMTCRDDGGRSLARPTSAGSLRASTEETAIARAVGRDGPWARTDGGPVVRAGVHAAISSGASRRCAATAEGRTALWLGPLNARRANAGSVGWRGEGAGH